MTSRIGFPENEFFRHAADLLVHRLRPDHFHEMVIEKGDLVPSIECAISMRSPSIVRM